MPQASGILRYDPRVVTTEGEIFDPWWLILEYDSMILDRFRAQVESDFNIRLAYPRWGAHITVIAGEVPRRKNRWGFREGDRIPFEFSSEVATDRTFYWLPVYCEDLPAIRERLGLRRIPNQGFHMTLGRVKR